MEKFDNNFKVGTEVLIEGMEEFVAITEIHETRNWIKVKGYVGSFQRGHVAKYRMKTPRIESPKGFKLYTVKDRNRGMNNQSVEIVARSKAKAEFLARHAHGLGRGMSGYVDATLHVDAEVLEIYVDEYDDKCVYEYFSGYAAVKVPWANHEYEVAASFEGFKK